MPFLSRLAAPIALALAAMAVPAQASSSLPANGTASDPTQAQASVPPVSHRSAFTRYRPLADVTPVPWREANETVNRIGGWRAYAREAAAPEETPAAATPALPPQKATQKQPSGRHHGH